MDSEVPTVTCEPLAWPAEVMTAAEVAAVLRITPKTVREHIRRGRLRAMRIDGAGPYRVRAVDAQEWADGLLVAPDAGALAVDRYVTSSRRRRVGRMAP